MAQQKTDRLQFNKTDQILKNVDPKLLKEIFKWQIGLLLLLISI